MIARLVRRPSALPTLFIHPPCGCGLSPVAAWMAEPYGLVECLMCGAVWVEVIAG